MKQLISANFAPFIGNDPLSVIGSVFCIGAEADRFGILNKYSPYNFIVNPMKEKFDFTTTDKTMEEIIDAVAIELLLKAKANNKKLVVLWSGGIDSTAIVCALIKNGCTKDQLVLLYTQHSIEEYELMYRKMRNAGYRMYKFTWKSLHKAYELFPNDYLVIGWCADQLFGSILNQQYPDEYRKPFKEGFTNILKQRGILTDVAKFSIEVFDDYAKSLGIELKYTCDALWWFNFAIKWSQISMDLSMTIRNETQRENVVIFFEDLRFQQWAFTHYKEFYREHQVDPKSYKRPLKDYIFKCNLDKDYFDNKGKVGSWGKNGVRYLIYDIMCIVDTNGYHIIDLTIPTPWSKDLLNQIHQQDANRMYHLLDYLKPNVDLEKVKHRVINKLYR